MFAPVALAVAVVFAPLPEDPPHVKPEAVLVEHAEAAEAREFLRDVARARDLVTWVDAVNAPPPTINPDARATDPGVTINPEPPDARASADQPAGCERVFAIPTEIVRRESGCDYGARNPNSSAGGAYQMIQSTANTAARAIGRPDLVGVNASAWPPDAQDAAAAWLWNGGQGCGHWAPTNGCG